MNELDKYHIPEDRNDATLHLVPRCRISEARLLHLHGVDRDNFTFFKPLLQMKFHHLQTVFEFFFVALVDHPTQPQEPNEFWAQDTLNLLFSIILVNVGWVAQSV